MPCHISSLGRTGRFGCHRQRPSTLPFSATPNKRSSSPVRSRDPDRPGQKNAPRVCRSPCRSQRKGTKGFEFNAVRRRLSTLQAGFSREDIATKTSFFLRIQIEDLLKRNDYVNNVSLGVG